MIGGRAAAVARADLLLQGGIAPGGEPPHGVQATPRGAGGWLWLYGAVVGGVALSYPVIGILGGITGGAIVALVRARRRFARMEAFERDYPTLLVALASSVRAGLDPLVAMTTAASLFPSGSLLQGELRRFAAAIEGGADEEEAVRSFGGSIGHPDLALLRNAYLIARREGGSLGECLHRLARVTRQRQSFRRKIRGAVAMQRLSAFGIAGCAGVIGLFQVVTNPRGVGAALQDPHGIVALSIGGGAMCGGLLWMIWIVRSRI